VLTFSNILEGLVLTIFALSSGGNAIVGDGSFSSSSSCDPKLSSVPIALSINAFEDSC